MTRRFFLSTSAAFLASACSLDRAPCLNVFNWSSYIDPKMLDRFRAETGIRIRYAVYESNEEMLAKVITGNSGWDVVFPTHSRIAPMLRAKLIAPLDHSRLTNLDQLDPIFRAPSWDPQLRFCVPYMWNATGIAFSAALDPPPEAWADLWSPRLRGRLTMLDDPEDVIGACLLKLGRSFDAIDRSTLEQARAAAIAEKQYVRAYLNAEVRDQLVAGDVLAAQMWSTTAQQAISAQQQNHKLAFAFPREGFPLYCDNAVILAESDRREAAHKFLNFLLRPEVAAANAAAGETATANAGGRALLAPAIRESPVLYPPQQTMRRGVWPTALPQAAQQLRDRIWTEIKSA